MSGTIAINRELSSDVADRIRQAAPGWTVVSRQESRNWNTLLKQAEIVVNWSDETAQACLSPDAALRWVHVWGAGVNHLPLSAFAASGVTLTNSSGVHARCIAETVFAMTLGYKRMLFHYLRNQLQRRWDRSGMPQEIHGDTMGIVGVGSIGQEVARLAKGFGMHVLGVRRSGASAEHVDEMYTIEEFPRLLDKSDYVVNIIPLTEHTRHFIGRDQFAQMKRNAFYINVGRGETTDTEALVHALSNGQIAGAGLDVFEQEPLPESHPLWHMENVILTPHTAGLTQHYERKALDIFLTNLKAYQKTGQPIVNLVEYERQY